MKIMLYVGWVSTILIAVHPFLVLYNDIPVPYSV